MQHSFFQDGLKTADKMRQHIDNLAAELFNVSRWYDTLHGVSLTAALLSDLYCVARSSRARMTRRSN